MSYIRDFPHTQLSPPTRCLSQDLWDIRTETLDGVANKHTRKYVDTPEEKRSIEPYKEAGHW